MIAVGRRVGRIETALLSRIDQQAPVAAADAVGVFVIVERKEHKLLGVGAERLQEDVDFVGGHQLQALRDFGRNEEEFVSMAGENDVFQILEVEGDELIVEPMRTAKDVQVGMAE